jgi:hypothetical protein
MKSPGNVGNAGMAFTGFDGAVRMQDRDQYENHKHCPKCGGRARPMPSRHDECMACSRPLRWIPVGDEGRGFYVLVQPRTVESGTGAQHYSKRSGGRKA